MILEVTNSINNPNWQRLPDVYPHHITASAKVKKIFTGDLEHKVITYPHFSGQEKHLVRAVIARITSATVLNVKGYLVADDDGNVAEAEE